MRGTAADPEKDECVGQDHRRGIEAVLTVNRSKKASRLSFDFVFEKRSSFSNSFYAPWILNSQMSTNWVVWA